MGFISSRLLVYKYVDSQDSFINNLKTGKNVLVIGGAGYIGSSLVSQLLEKNYNLVLEDQIIIHLDSDSVHGYVAPYFKEHICSILNKLYVQTVC